MKRISILLLATFVMGCGQKNAITNRGGGLSLVSEQYMQQEATAEYQKFLAENKVVSSAANDAEMVRRIGQRISTAIVKFYTDQGKGDMFKSYKWEYNLVDNKEANAWCMPGGKIVVYTGLLPLTKTENALAVVMGHEVAHAVLEHGRERMNSEMVRQGLGTLGSVFLSGKSPETQAIFQNVYGIGSQVGYALPNSRKQESEADEYGLTYCALAGYDPREAVPFWERMASASSGQKPPELLSTHPSDETRIKQIKEKYLPEALKYYKK